MTERPTLTTNLAYAGWHEHVFRDRLVFADLAGSIDFWNLLSLAIEGPPVDELAAKVLDLMSVAAAAADPRLPPMKLIRLVASYGRTLPALGAGYAYHEDGLIGVWMTCRSGKLLQSLADELGDSIHDPDAVHAAVKARIERREILQGFGVPGRPIDERVVGFEKVIRRLGCDKGQTWRLLKLVEDSVRRLVKQPMNITIAIAAAGMDLGYSPYQIGVVTTAISLPAFAGNAVEGAAQAPECLRSLPEDWVDDQTRAPRESPRRREWKEKRTK